MRKFLASKVYKFSTEGLQIHTHTVVTIDAEGLVCDVSSLSGEIERVEWLIGAILLLPASYLPQIEKWETWVQGKAGESVLPVVYYAYHIPVFDVEKNRPIDSAILRLGVK